MHKIKYLLLSLLLISGCSNQINNQLTISLDYSPNINYLGIYMAQELGYYQDANINIKLLNASDVTPEQNVLTNKAELGFSYGENLLMDHNNQDLVSIYAPYTTNLSGFISKQEKNITTISDFANKTYCGWGSDNEKNIISTLMKNHGVDPNSLTYINAGELNITTDVSDKCDIFWSYEYWGNQQAKEKGIKYNYISLPSLGLNYYTPLIMANKQMPHRELYKPFIEATIKGFRYAIDHPDEAVRVLQKNDPQISSEVIKGGIDVIKNYINPSGAQNPAIWQEFSQFLTNNNVAANPVLGVYSNEFVNN